MRGSTTRVLTELGKALEQARKAAGLSGRQAAGQARFAAATWPNTIYGSVPFKDESGVRRLRPVRPSDETVAAAARAVGLDVEHALQLPREVVTDRTLNVTVDLSAVSTDDLWEELRRRVA